MRKFIVEVEEIHTVTYYVEAIDAAAALFNVQHHERYPHQGMRFRDREYTRTLDDTWKATLIDVED